MKFREGTRGVNGLLRHDGWSYGRWRWWGWPHLYDKQLPASWKLWTWPLPYIRDWDVRYRQAQDRIYFQWTRKTRRNSSYCSRRCWAFARCRSVDDRFLLPQVYTFSWRKLNPFRVITKWNNYDSWTRNNCPFVRCFPNIIFIYFDLYIYFFISTQRCSSNGRYWRLCLVPWWGSSLATNITFETDVYGLLTSMRFLLRTNAVRRRHWCQYVFRGFFHQSRWPEHSSTFLGPKWKQLSYDRAFRLYIVYSTLRIIHIASSF